MKKQYKLSKDNDEVDSYSEELKELYISDEEGVWLDTGEETKLFGRDGNLDSLGLINLIVLVEQNIEEEFDTIITLADEKAISQKRSPFKTIGSLTDYIYLLIN